VTFIERDDASRPAVVEQETDDGAPALVEMELDGGVAVLTLADPAHRNALSHAMSSALASAVDQALAGGARALVLTAEPPVFCAGGSLDDLIAPKVPLRETYAGFLRLANAPIPTIAAVNGPCIGAGVNLPLACDVILTSARATFDPRFLDVGIHPGGGHLWRLERRIGRQGAAALVLFGDRLDGHEAASHGLAWRCVDEDELLPTALRYARRAASRPSELVACTQESLHASGAIADAQSAFELELAAQEWSVARPGFTDQVMAIRDALQAARMAKGYATD
jgi:enoyl-CoA hydratase